MKEEKCPLLSLKCLSGRKVIHAFTIADSLCIHSLRLTLESLPTSFLSRLRVPGGDTECRTGYGIMGRTGCTGQCILFGPLFHFVCDILHPHPIHTFPFNCFYWDSHKGGPKVAITPFLPCVPWKIEKRGLHLDKRPISEIFWDVAFKVTFWVSSASRL